MRGYRTIVRCVENGQVYSSLKEASCDLDMCMSALSRGVRLNHPVMGKHFEVISEGQYPSWDGAPSVAMEGKTVL